MGLQEDLMEMLFGFSDVLADNARQVDFVQVQPQFIRENACGHGLACSARAKEENIQPLAHRHLLTESPIGVDDVAIAMRGGDRMQLLHGTGRKNEVTPLLLRLDLLREPSQTFAGLLSGGTLKPANRKTAFAQPCVQRCVPARGVDLSSGKGEFAAERAE